MNMIKLALPALLGLLLINSATAAELTDSGSGEQKIGVVSASGAYSLDDLTEQLSQKASEEGASSFKIISTSGQNKLHGVAEIYK